MGEIEKRGRPENGGDCIVTPKHSQCNVHMPKYVRDGCFVCLKKLCPIYLCLLNSSCLKDPNCIFVDSFSIESFTPHPLASLPLLLYQLQDLDVCVLHYTRQKYVVL